MNLLKSVLFFVIILAIPFFGNAQECSYNQLRQEVDTTSPFPEIYHVNVKYEFTEHEVTYSHVPIDANPMKAFVFKGIRIPRGTQQFRDSLMQIDTFLGRPTILYSTNSRFVREDWLDADPHTVDTYYPMVLVYLFEHDTCPFYVFALDADMARFYDLSVGLLSPVIAMNQIINSTSDSFMIYNAQGGTDEK